MRSWHIRSRHKRTNSYTVCHGCERFTIMTHTRTRGHEAPECGVTDTVRAAMTYSVLCHQQLPLALKSTDADVWPAPLDGVELNGYMLSQ